MIAFIQCKVSSLVTVGFGYHQTRSRHFHFTVACGITLFGGSQAKALEVVRLFPGKGNGRSMYTNLSKLDKKHRQVTVIKICAFKRAEWLAAPALDWKKHAPTVAAHCTCSGVKYF